MAVIIQSELDPKGVQIGVDQTQAALQKEIGGALQGVEQKAKEAEKNLKGMFDLQKIQAAAGAFGALKSILDKAGQSVLGLSENTQKAVSASLELAQQGIALGAVFGPVGAAIGGVVGGLIGYISATNDAEEATIKLAQAEKDKYEQDLKIAEGLATLTLRADAGVQDLRIAFEKFLAVSSGDEFGIVGKNLDQLVDKFGDVSDKITDMRERAAKQLARLKAAESSQTADQSNIVDDATKQLAALESQLSEARREQDAYQKSIDALTPKIKDQTAAIKEQKEVLVGVRGPTITVDIDQVKRDQQAKIDAAKDALIKQTELNLGFEQAAQDHEERVANTRMRLAQEAAEAQKKSIEDVTLSMLESSERMKEAMRDAFVDVGVGAVNTLFDNIEAGKKPLDSLGKSFAKLAAEQLRGVGTTLIGEGLQNELKAAAMAISSLGVLSGPAAALAGVGAAQLALGLSLGGVGALIGRRSHGGATTSTGGSESLGAREAEASGPTQLAPVKMYLGPENGIAVFADDQRGVSSFGKFTTNAQDMAKKAPR